MRERLENIIKKIDILHILILLISILLCKSFFGCIIAPLYDAGREILLPDMVNSGKVLYKDIFNIFGPLSYQFTALLYKIFGASVHTYLMIGCTCALLIVSGIYKITKTVIDKNVAFVVSFFSIVIGIANINFCNASYIAPYSTAIIYGLVAFIWSVYFLIKSVRQENKNYILISSFLAGVAFCSKYEFALYFIMVFVYTCMELFPKDKKKWVISLSLLCLPSIICYGILFFQGLTYSELYNASNLINDLIKTPFYQSFYRKYGTILCLDSLKYFIFSCCQFLVIVGFYYLVLKFCKNKWLKAFTIFLSVILISYFKWFYINEYLKIENIFAFLPILTVIFAIFSFKNLDKTSKLLVSSAILVSYKVLWRLSLFHYGVYFAPPLVIALLKMANGKLRKSILIVICTVSLILLNDFIQMKNVTDTEINVKDVPVYTDLLTAKKIGKTVRYIEKNTKPEDTVIICPEGHIINFLTGRKTDSKHYSFNPEHLELFGEDNIIKHFEETTPELFVIIPKLTLSEPDDILCKTYGKNFCKYLDQNYSKKVIFRFAERELDSVIVYKKKR